MSYLEEGGTLGNFLGSVDQGAKVGGCDSRVMDQFNEVIDDDDGTTSGFHASIVESTEQERDKNRQSRSFDLCNKSCVRE